MLPPCILAENVEKLGGMEWCHIQKSIYLHSELYNVMCPSIYLQYQRDEACTAHGDVPVDVEIVENVFIVYLHMLCYLGQRCPSFLSCLH